MPTLVEALTQGIAHQRAGRLSAAEAIYREILQRHPGNADAWHLLGLLKHDEGDDDAALDLVGRALALALGPAPFHNSLGIILHSRGRLVEARSAFETALRLDAAFAQAHSNLGNLLQSQGLPGEAIAHYAAALKATPESAEIYNNLGNAHLALERPEQAVNCFRAALARQPGYAEALANLGGALERLDRLADAEACCRQALGLRPDLPEAHSNLAAVLSRQERFQEAEACCREALRMRPGFAPAWCNLGNILTDLKRVPEAEDCCRQALLHGPQHPESWNNLGSALHLQDRNEEAVPCYREALRLRPRYADAKANLGAAHCSLGRFEEAMACYDEALRMAPDHADARMNRALLLLLQGRMEEGWREYEWRWKTRAMRPRNFSQPLWDGSPLGRRTLLVTAEQGLGDTIQFVRYLPLIKREGARVLLQCQPQLVPLLRGFRGADQVMAHGQQLPGFDVHIGLLSLPRLVGGGRIPEAPYLPADPRLVSEWSREFPAAGPMRVGLCWAGNPAQAQNHQRSVPVERFEGLAGMPGVRCFSLQKVVKATPGWLQEIEHPGGEICDTAAIIMNLDLIVTVDTMIAHLAGALGKPVWILLPFVADWRWLRERRDTPWYSTARLFRQERPGNWDTVLESLESALSKECERHYSMFGDSGR